MYHPRAGLQRGGLALGFYYDVKRGYDMWKDKKIYVKIRNTNRSYSGIVLEENEFSITIKDIVGHLVSINKSEASIIQEEE